MKELQSLFNSLTTREISERLRVGYTTVYMWRTKQSEPSSLAQEKIVALHFEVQSQKKGLANVKSQRRDSSLARA